MRFWKLLIVPALVASASNTVRAGGLEYTGAGAQALGRGGAVAAKADDPMVLAYNPAGLAELRGSQLLLDVNFAQMNACVDPIGFYGWGAYGGGTPSRLTNPKTGDVLELNLGDGKPGPADMYYSDKLDTVCMKPRPFPVPQLAFTARLTERLGVGFGLIFPAATPQGQWGESNGVIQGANGLRPAPTRYMMIQAGTLGLFPTAGFGFRVTNWLRIGAAFEWGVINIDNLSMAAKVGGTNPAGDILARANGTDWFVPAATGSIHIVPIDAIDIVAAFRWSSDVDAPGTLQLTTGTFDTGGAALANTLQIQRINQKMPWKARAGIRYASRLAPRPAGTGHDEAGAGPPQRVRDAFEDERWDVEADIEYQMNSRNQEQVVSGALNQTVGFAFANGTTNSVVYPMSAWRGGTTDTVIQKRWKDQLSVRVGGSYNILPGLFGVSVGAHYETRGVDPSYMQIDYWPVSRLGLHGGVRFRVGRTIDLVASYSHMFQETLVVGAPPSDPGGAAAISTKFSNTGVIDAIDKHAGVAATRGAEIPELQEPATANINGVAKVQQVTTSVSQGRPPTLVNAGTYRSSIDVVAVGVNVHF